MGLSNNAHVNIMVFQICLQGNRRPHLVLYFGETADVLKDVADVLKDVVNCFKP